MIFNNSSAILPFLALMLIGVLITGTAYAFHEYLPQLDTQSKIKTYYKEHVKSDPDFQARVEQIDVVARNVSFSCGLNNIFSNLLTGVGSEPSEHIDANMAKCDKIIPYLSVYCGHHYNVFSFCKDEKKTFGKYISDRGLLGKVIDINLSWDTYNHAAMMELGSQGQSESESESQTSSSSTLPERESTNEYVGTQSIDSLKEQFSNLNK